MKRRKKKMRFKLYMISQRGSLSLPRKVKYEAEVAACELTGKKITVECAAVAAWREAIDVSAQAGKFVLAATQEAKVARAVHLLRAERRPLREKPMAGQRAVRHLWLGLVDVPGQDDTDRLSGRPGVLYVSIGAPAFAGVGGRESFDSLFSRQEALSPEGNGLGAGALLGGIAVCVRDRSGRALGLVVWNRSHHAEDLYQLATWGEPDVVRRLARRALRREARRVLNKVQLLREQAAQKKAQFEQAEAKAE